MAYTDFTNFAQLKAEFGITYQRTLLFDKTQLEPLEATDVLKAMLRRAQHFPLTTEKAKSEAVIMPIVEDVWEAANQAFTCFSGFTFDVDKDKKLNGRCDYILSGERDVLEIVAPVFCLIEAKDRTIEEGLSQAIAEMYAAHIFNERNNSVVPILYGCVTNAHDWCFLELHQGSKALIDTERYHITTNELPLLLANFQRIVQAI